MAAVLTRNDLVEADNAPEIEPPRKSNGDGYRFEMIFNGGGSRAYADTAVELIDVLIPGYEALDTNARVQARVTYGTALLPRVQATVLQDVDQEAIPEAEKSVLLQPRFEAVVVDEWASEVPLVLLDVHYAPHSEIPAPRSALEDVASPRNLIWVRVIEDYDMLLSLHDIGLINLAESNDFIV